MSNNDDLQDLPLPVLFRRAEAAFQKLQASPGAPAEQRRLVDDCIAYLTHAAALVGSLGVFSANEDKDDLATGDIKYFLIPHWRAEVLAQAASSSPADRLSALKSALAFQQAFLLRVQQYALLSDAAAGCVEAALQGGKMDATSLRQLKIERFKLERSVKSRLEALQKRLGGASGNRSNLSGRRGDGSDGDSDGDDEAAEREAAVLRVEAAALRASETLASLQQELEVLKHAAAMTEQERAAVQSQPPPQELIEELRRAAGSLRLGGEASAAAHREALRQGVFKPSHILPTMTVEQQGRIEVAQMMERQRAEAAGKAAAAAAKLEMSREAEEEEELQRQRAKDDWNDDNPRGWGNSKLRPCG